ncbi:MAG: glycosyltransferase [Gammaproteobacteria bacterium]|nr:glycosyltransferase [Gammaproteobacteria bacterium]
MINETSPDSNRRVGRPGQKRRVLWWGRSDPGYARNAILRRCLVDAGFEIHDFRPSFSPLGDLEAALRLRTGADLVWVPSFRQRDLAAAARFCKRRALPLVFDPLISAYDKQVDERKKFPPGSAAANRLLAWERRLFGAADRLLADTPAHAEYFHRTHGVARERMVVVPMSAEEDLFRPSPVPPASAGPLEVLFFGSFLPLQAPEVIVEAANRYQGSPVVWRLLGAGPALNACRRLVRQGTAVEFEDWLPYAELPSRIAQAQIVAGIFGNTPKAQRVVPNKVCQALACGRPLVTRDSPALPPQLGQDPESGVTLVPPADPAALASAVAALAGSPETLAERGRWAQQSYRRHFSSARVKAALASGLDGLLDFPVPR